MILLPVKIANLYDLPARRFVHRPGVSFTGQAFRSRHAGMTCPRLCVYSTCVQDKDLIKYKQAFHEFV